MTVKILAISFLFLALLHRPGHANDDISSTIPQTPVAVTVSKTSVPAISESGTNATSTSMTATPSTLKPSSTGDPNNSQKERDVNSSKCIEDFKSLNNKNLLVTLSPERAILASSIKAVEYCELQSQIEKLNASCSIADTSSADENSVTIISMTLTALFKVVCKKSDFLAPLSLIDKKCNDSLLTLTRNCSSSSSATQYPSELLLHMVQQRSECNTLKGVQNCVVTGLKNDDCLESQITVISASLEPIVKISCMNENPSDVSPSVTTSTKSPESPTTTAKSRNSAPQIPSSNNIFVAVLALLLLFKFN